jgi:hypothetical protein
VMLPRRFNWRRPRLLHRGLLRADRR